ncbi:ribonuclease domain-containing protein [Arthrobacter sp. NPDC093139]|uniref:ribonuclease domain-containing protein n=1 Tax=Arthrobacter sp. NPDC093139 TaxID=3363945 RepID=UPI0037FEACF4
MRRLLAAVVLIVLLGVALVVSNGLQPQAGGPLAESGPAVPSPRALGATAGAGGVPNPSALPTIPESQLPAEGRTTLALIRRGGPFPYERDGATFGNFERILPRKSRDYYREYTVPTPGEPDRGARRIVAGKAGEKYYTADHYESFKFIAEGK